MGKAHNFGNKIKWLADLFPISGKCDHAWSGISPEGVIVDLHVVRMAPRLGIASGTNPKKIEEQSSKLYRKKNEMQERQCHSLEEKSAGQLVNVKSV